MDESMAAGAAVASRRRFRSSHGHLLIGLASVLAGLFLLYEGRDYEIGTLERPGPGAFPLIICLGLVGTGVLIAVTAALGKGDDDGEIADDGGNARALLLMLTMLGFIAGVYFIGFTVSSLVAAYVMVHLLGSTLGIVGRVVYVVALILVTEVMFTLLFGISFPGGLVGTVLR